MLFPFTIGHCILGVLCAAVVMQRIRVYQQRHGAVYRLESNFSESSGMVSLERDFTGSGARGRTDIMTKPGNEKPSVWEQLMTEAINPRSLALDTMSALEIVDLMNSIDHDVVRAVHAEREKVARAVELIAGCLTRGGRLTYVGAGTSGRLGVLDASECPPTFGTDPELVRGVIAGGPRAVWRSVEGSEDDPSAGVRAAARRVRAGDVLVGVSASSVTPFVRGALGEARRKKAGTVLLTCVPSRSSALEGVEVDIIICPVVGPEVLTGSTRLKAGTATKMILNMFSTASMVLIGKAYGNLMVDLKPWSRKLRDRSVRIVHLSTGLERPVCRHWLEKSGWDTKTAIVMAKLGVSRKRARELIGESGGSLRHTLGEPPFYTGDYAGEKSSR